MGLNFGKKTGNIFVSADLNGEVKIWNLLQGSFEQTKVPLEELNFVKISPNEKLIVVGSKNKNLVILEAIKGGIVKTFAAHKKGIWDAEFNSVSTQLASCSSDQQIKLWSVDNREFTNVMTLEASSPVLKVKYAVHDLQLISSHSDGVLSIWNLVKGTLVFKLAQKES